MVEGDLGGTMSRFVSRIGELRYFHPSEWFHFGRKSPTEASGRPSERDDPCFLGMISMTPEPDSNLGLDHLALATCDDARAEDPWLAVD
jgi:hypothetical protein